MKCKYCRKQKKLAYTQDVCEACYEELGKETFGQKLIVGLKEALEHVQGKRKLRETRLVRKVPRVRR